MTPAELERRSSQIWIMAREMGQTLDSERAVKKIMRHIQAAISSETIRVERSRETESRQRKRVRALKREISKLMSIIRKVDPGRLQ